MNRSLRRVEGDSMSPTLTAGDRILTLPTTVFTPRVGDVVVVPDPRRRSRATVKRVAALPGRTVDTDVGTIRAGAGQLVVLGDNATASTDSRVFGPVALTDVQAVVIARVSPEPRWLL